MAYRPRGAVWIGVYMSQTITASAASTSSIERWGSTRMLPKQRNGSFVAPTIDTSSSASPGSPVVMSG